MTHHARPSSFLHLTLALALAGTTLRAQTVEYPSSTLASPPQFAFPFYTPGSGSSGATVRVQCLCADSFLATQPLSAGLVTHVGFSLAGEATYDTFVLRAGVTSATTLGTDWLTNLPDQRVQRDLSNELLQGGGTAAAPANQWVDFELDYPFYWQPGQNIVVDLTTHVAVPGTVLGTTVGTGVPRAYNFGYTAGASATNVTSSGGVAFRLVFTPPDMVSFGAGCPGTGGLVPQLTAVGQPSLGNSSFVLVADQALPGTLGGFLFGTSRRTFAGAPLPLDLGGGCTLLVSPDVFAPAPITPNGVGGGTAAVGLPIPATPSLASAVIYAQFTQLDAASAASVPLVFSNAGTIVVF